MKKLLAGLFVGVLMLPSFAHAQVLQTDLDTQLNALKMQLIELLMLQVTMLQAQLETLGEKQVVTEERITKVEQETTPVVDDQEATPEPEAAKPQAKEVRVYDLYDFTLSDNGGGTLFVAQVEPISDEISYAELSFEIQDSGGNTVTPSAFSVSTNKKAKINGVFEEGRTTTVTLSVNFGPPFVKGQTYTLTADFPNLSKEDGSAITSEFPYTGTFTVK